MKKVNGVWNYDLIQHKKMMCNYNKEKETDKYNAKVKMLGEMLNLAYYDFKCVKCGGNNGLTMHHIVERNNYPFLKPEISFQLRNYWLNMFPLCVKCHNEIHGVSNSLKTISNNKIINLKKKYEYKGDLK